MAKSTCAGPPITNHSPTSFCHEPLPPLDGRPDARGLFIRQPHRYPLDAAAPAPSRRTRARMRPVWWNLQTPKALEQGQVLPVLFGQHQVPVTTNVLVAIITGYCSCQRCCGPNATGLTASGRAPIVGKTVAAPRSVLLGSTVVIAGHRYTAQDRTARRFEGRFDIYFTNHAAARRFGIQTNTVTVITP